MIGDKKVIKDPFVGEIELTNVGETSRHAVGEHIVDTIYEDSRGNYYIDTWCTAPGEPQPMVFLRKPLVEELTRIRRSKELEDIQPSDEVLDIQESMRNKGK